MRRDDMILAFGQIHADLQSIKENIIPKARFVVVEKGFYGLVGFLLSLLLVFITIGVKI